MKFFYEPQGVSIQPATHMVFEDSADSNLRADVQKIILTSTDLTEQERRQLEKYLESLKSKDLQKVSTMPWKMLKKRVLDFDISQMTSKLSKHKDCSSQEIKKRKQKAGNKTLDPEKLNRIDLLKEEQIDELQKWKA